MGWELKVEGIDAYPSPTRRIDLKVELHWNGDSYDAPRGGEPIELLAARYWGTAGGVHWPATALPMSTGPIAMVGWSISLVLAVPIDAVTLAAIERARNGQRGVSFEFMVEAHWRHLYPTAIPEQRPTDPFGDAPSIPPAAYAVGTPTHGQFRASYQLERDAWLRVLAALKWDSFDVFEIPVRVLGELKEFGSALAHLRLAREAFLLGNWPSTVLEVRKACEAAAAAAAPGNAKRGFAAMLERALPDNADEPFRAALDALMRALADLRNAGGGHGGNPQPRREEAELALTVGVAVFRCLGQALDGQR